MSTQEERLSTVEKDMVLMKHDIIYKIDDMNSAVTMLRGVMSTQGRDIKFLINQVKGIDIRLEGLDQEVRMIKDQQDTQGLDIKDIKRSLDAMASRFDQMLLLLTTFTTKAED